MRLFVGLFLYEKKYMLKLAVAASYCSTKRPPKHNQSKDYPTSESLNPQERKKKTSKKSARPKRDTQCLNHLEKATMSKHKTRLIKGRDPQVIFLNSYFTVKSSCLFVDSWANKMTILSKYKLQTINSLRNCINQKIEYIVVFGSEARAMDSSNKMNPLQIFMI